MEAKYVLIALVAIFGLTQAANAPQTPDIQKLIKEFQTSFDKTAAEVRKSLNLPEHPDGAAIVRALREQSNKAEKALADMKGKLDESIKKNPELANAMKNVEAKIEEGRNKLKKENPEVAANAQMIADTVKHVYTSVGKEFEKVHAEVIKRGGLRDDFDNLLKNLIDRGTVAAKEFNNKVQEVVKQVTTASKH